MTSQQAVVGERAPDFELPDSSGQGVTLGSLLKNGPLLLVFYPGDFTMVCTKQLCNYRDNREKFSQFGIQVVGVSANDPDSHSKFAQQYDLPFKLLSDPDKRVARAFGCTSLLMFGGISRAVFIITGTLNPLSLRTESLMNWLKLLKICEKKDFWSKRISPVLGATLRV